MRTTDANNKKDIILRALNITKRGNVYEPLARALLAEACLDLNDTPNAIQQVSMSEYFLTQEVRTGDKYYDHVFIKLDRIRLDTEVKNFPASSLTIQILSKIKSRIDVVPVLVPRDKWDQ